MFGPLQLFMIAALFSPGPNVILLITSGARFGMYKTLPHLFGVVLGVAVIGGVAGVGVGTILKQLPVLEMTLCIIAIAWILWMAIGLWRSSNIQSNGSFRPMTFIQAILFQWINPKIWAVAIAGTAYLVGHAPLEQALNLGATMSITNLFVCYFWTYFGQLLSGFLEAGKPRILFLRTMACLLGLSAVLVLIK